MMYNRRLTTFVQVADCGSFSKAAEILYLSPPAVMKQINSLESQLGIKLFARTNQGIRLTEAGESIYKDARYLMAYSDKAIEKARNLIVVPEYTLCVATSLLNPCKPFMDLWNAIRCDFPQYKLHIKPFDDDNQGIASVIGSLGKENDFVVGICDSDIWRERCNFLKLGDYERCYAVPMTHRLAAKSSLTLQDIYDETLLLGKEGNFQGSEWDMLASEHPRIRLVEAPHFYSMAVFNQCVHMGAILASVECWKDIHPSLVTLPIKPESSVAYGLLYAPDPPEDIVQIVEALQAVAG